MHEITDITYRDILTNDFHNGKTVVVGISTSIMCANCRTTKSNIESLIKKYPKNNLEFYYVDYTKYDILQGYYQLNPFVDYPKSIVFYGSWEDKDFMEGVITEDKLEYIYQKSKDVKKFYSTSN